MITSEQTVEALRRYHNSGVGTPNIWEHSLFGVASLMLESQAAELAALKEAQRMDRAVQLFANDLAFYEQYCEDPPNLFYKNDVEKYECINNWRTRAAFLRAILPRDTPLPAPPVMEEG